MIRWGQGKRTVAVAAVLVVSAAVVGVSAADVATASGPSIGDNEGPLADGGLDRTVTENATVYLDATGSRDPDGTVDAYRWRIERPDGTYTNPACETCGWTQFVPREPGLYNATVVVTDDDGATASDTLRIRVNESSGPSVTVAGPEEVVAGRLAGFSASVSAGNMDLAAVVWRLDDRRLNRTTVSGDSALLDHGHVFGSAGEYTLRVEVVDRLGRVRSATENVTVVAPTPSSGRHSPGATAVGGGGGGAGSTSGDCYYPPDSVFSCETDSVVGINSENESVIVTDSDRDGNVTVNGETFSTREGDSININQTTWQEHHQPDPTSDIFDSGTQDPVHYQPGIQQESGNSNNDMVRDWNTVPSDLLPQVAGLGSSDSDGETGPWAGGSAQSAGNSGSRYTSSDNIPPRVEERINRRRGNQEKN